MPAGINQGIDEDTLVALELGVDSLQEMTDSQRTYKDKVKLKLLKVRTACPWRGGACMKTCAQGAMHGHACPSLRA